MAWSSEGVVQLNRGSLFWYHLELFVCVVDETTIAGAGGFRSSCPEKPALPRLSLPAMQTQPPGSDNE
jgi:hypothetical protein